MKTRKLALILGAGRMVASSCDADITAAFDDPLIDSEATHPAVSSVDAEKVGSALNPSPRFMTPTGPGILPGVEGEASKGGMEGGPASHHTGAR